jgi:hypothetical protein
MIGIFYSLSRGLIVTHVKFLNFTAIAESNVDELEGYMQCDL